MRDSQQAQLEISDSSLMNRQLESLNSVGIQLRQDLHSRDLLGLVAQEVINVTEADAVVIRFLQAPGLDRPVRISQGSSSLIAGLGDIEEIATNSQEVIYRQFKLEPGNLASVICYPIKSQEEVLGTFTVFGERVTGFKSISLSYISTLASFIVSAFDRILQKGELDQRSRLLHRRYQQLERVSVLFAQVDPRRPSDSLLHELTEAISQVMEYKTVILDLIDDDPEQNLRTIATFGLSEFEGPTLSEPVNQWKRIKELFRPEFALGESYFLPAEHYRSNNGNEGYKDGSTEQSLEQLLISTSLWRKGDRYIVPLRRSQEQPIGLLTLRDPVSGSRPDIDTALMAEVVARYAVTIIEKARLVTELESRDRAIDSLQGLDQRIQGAHGKTKILQETADGLLQLVDAVDCTIYELFPEGDTLIVSAVATKLPVAVAMQEGSSHELVHFDLISQVLNSKSPLLVNLGESEARYAQTAGLGSFTLVLLPMELGGKVIGIAELLIPRDKKDIGAKEIRLASDVLNRSAVVLENAQLFDETSQRERFLAALARVTLAMNHTIDQSAILPLICRESMSLFDVDGAYIWQKQGDMLFGVAASGYMEKQFIGAAASVSRAEVFAAVIAQNGRGNYCNQDQSQSNFSKHIPTFPSGGSVLGIPLRSDDEIIGVLVLADTKKGDRFNPDDMVRATHFVAQAGLAISNAYLVTELRELNNQLDAKVSQRTRALGEERERVRYLLRITRELSDSIDEERVVRKALELVGEVVNASRGVILLIDPIVGHQIYSMEYESTLSQWRPEPAEGRNSYLGLAGWVIENRSSVIVENLSEDARAIEMNREFDLNSALAVPLAAGDQVVGVLMLLHTKPAAFTREQGELVEAAARQVGSAIGNAQLFLLIKDQAEKLGQLLREETFESAMSQAILQSIADGVVVADAAGYIILANSAACELLRMSEEGLIGKLASDRLGLDLAFGEQWSASHAEWTRSSNTHPQRSILSHTLNVEDKFINVHLSPVFANDQFSGTVSIFRDVSHIVEADRMKSEFVSTVSHELRTPMTSIKGYADLMLMGMAGEITDEQRQYISVVKGNADRMTGLVNDLLDIARIESGKTKLELREVNVADVITVAVNNHLRGLIVNGEKKIEAKTEVEPSLPTVWADSERLLQILSNLIDNAYNYTPTEGTITLIAKATENSVLVTVADTGIGIKEDQQSKIFERFYRTDEDEVQRVAGTGLGLSIVHSLVSLHGGTIEVESAPSEGSSFVFSLPLAQKSNVINWSSIHSGGSR